MKKILSICWFCAFLFVEMSFLHGTQRNVKFEKLTMEQGLSHSSVFCIIQDRNGFMWFGTAEGLNRYDGYNFKIFKPDFFDTTAISDTWITALYEDLDGNIWIGTFGGGLNRFDIRTEKFTHFTNNPNDETSIADNVIYAITQDLTGTLWFGTNNGLSKYVNNKTFKNYSTKQKVKGEISNDEINTLYVDKYGTLWIGTNGGGLNKYDREKDSFSNYRNQKNNSCSISNDYIWAIATDPNDSKILWIATLNGLNKFNTESNCFNRIFLPTEGGIQKNNQIRSFLIDTNGDFWIGTRESGLWLYSVSTNTFQHFRYNRNDISGISENQILCVFQDRSHLIWVGTRGGELNKVVVSQFQHLYHKQYTNNSIANNTVWSIIEDKNENLWVGSNGGLNFINPRTNEYKLFQNDPSNPNSLSDNYVYSIYEDSSGILWVGTYEGGLNRYNKNTNTFKVYKHDEINPNSISHNYVRTICGDIDGTLWVGCRGGGVNHFDPKTETFTRYLHDPNNPNSISHDRVNVIIQEDINTIWIGTSGGGLNRFDKTEKRFTRFIPNRNNPNTLNNSYVISLCMAKNGKLWVGTYNGGLNLFNHANESFEHYTEAQGLINDVIYGICEDEHGFLWLSTNKGLVKFNPETLTFRNFDKNDGTQGSEFNTGSYHKGASGTIYFGGTNGLTLFHPNHIKENLFIPKITFTDIKLFNQSVKPSASSILSKPIFQTDIIVLGYNQNDISFEFSSMCYNSPHRNQYMYYMEGFDSGWIHNGTLNKIRYTNLPPGDYVLYVKASNSDGIWGENAKSIKINIVPPFWKTLWFNALMIIASFLIIYIVIVLREKQLVRTKNILEHKVRLRTQEIQQQKEEIEAQRDEIITQRDYVMQQRNEIESQRNSLANLAWDLQEKTEEIEKQKDILSLRNKEITDSIVYAQRIQSAVLPSEAYLSQHFKEFFVLYKPKSIVSGDFFWATRVKQFLVFCVTDCTGHGVPGAFMSMMGVSFLNEIVRNDEVSSAGEVLNVLREYVVSSLEERGGIGVQFDGMDIGLCVLDIHTLILQFAGANIPCWIATTANSFADLQERISYENGLIEIKPDRMPIGRFERMDSFVTVEYQLEINNAVYLASDGFADQFGGLHEKKYQKAALMKLIADSKDFPMESQKDILEKSFEVWKGDRNQIDDVTIFGIKV